MTVKQNDFEKLSELSLIQEVKKKAINFGYLMFIALFISGLLYVIYYNLSFLSSYSVFSLILLIPTCYILHAIAVLFSIMSEPLITKLFMRYLMRD